MPPTPQQQARLALLAEQLDACAHGGKDALVRSACSELGIAPQTLHRWLTPHKSSQRKRRTDAGSTALTRVEAELVSAVLMEGRRLNGKQIVSLTDAVRWLRENGHVIGGRVIDNETGEIVPLSESAISRALLHYQLHPRQLRVATPHQPLSSPHPNHTWQVDASVCVVFYLPDNKAGMCALRDEVHYKNKPENLKAIEQFRVIRYVATDHTSGAIRVRYYPHSESGEHTVMFLAWLMAPKAGKNDPFHGAPVNVMVDPGATSAGLVKRFCQRLGVNLIVNKPGNPRAKGQVEQGNNLWETKFESGLRFQTRRITCFDDLNALAATWQLYFNATETHSRHGKTRFGKWLEITPAQLRITADEATLLQLATREPKECTVRGDLSIAFMSRSFRVNTLIEFGVAIGGKVAVHWHPFIANTAMAVMQASDGRELHIPLVEITKDEHGFPSHAAEINAEFKAQPDTQADTNRKAIEQLASGTDTQKSATVARRQKDYQPLGGALNPFKAAEEAPIVPFLPRAGIPLTITQEAPVMLARVLTVTDAAMQLRDMLGTAYRPEFFEFLQRRFADGLPEDQLERLAEQWRNNGEVRHAAVG